MIYNGKYIYQTFEDRVREIDEMYAECELKVESFFFDKIKQGSKNCEIRKIKHKEKLRNSKFIKFICGEKSVIKKITGNLKIFNNMYDLNEYCELNDLKHFASAMFLYQYFRDYDESR